MSQSQHRLGPLAAAADYAVVFRQTQRPLHPTASVDDLREQFCIELPERPRDGTAVIADLIAAAEPGLVGNTNANFFAWVMGSSNTTGVAADWLTSIWGQNAAIYQTSPSAAVAEEAVATWVLDLLDLPRQSSVGLVTGATMAAFVALAAARSAVLKRAGHDFEANGLQGAPFIKVFLSDDAHVTNLTAVRHIGLGDANCEAVASDAKGCMELSALKQALELHDGPKIIIAQAGHINSGAFEDFSKIAELARKHNAWLHVDGAFGLWARVAPSRVHLTRGVELADSWSVDGHKWLQVPYDSGFAIVRDADAHRRAMDITASYLNASHEDGRNPTHYNPELSRRARGFAAWAVMQSLGRKGIASIVEKHCECARTMAKRLDRIVGLQVINEVDLNQIVIAPQPPQQSGQMSALAARLNATGNIFVRPAIWKGVEVLRLSFISQDTTKTGSIRLAQTIERCWREIQSEQ